MSLYIGILVDDKLTRENLIEQRDFYKSRMGALNELIDDINDRHDKIIDNFKWIIGVLILSNVGLLGILIF